MRKFIIISCLTGSLAIILGQFGFFEAFLMFIVAGAIPGTSYSVPSSIMYGLLLAIIALVIIRLIGFTALDFFLSLTEKLFVSKKKSQKQLPKRRYGQI